MNIWAGGKWLERGVPYLSKEGLLISDQARCATCMLVACIVIKASVSGFLYPRCFRLGEEKCNVPFLLKKKTNR